MLNAENKVPKEHIDTIIENAPKKVFTAFGNCTIVAMQMPNGFVIVEHSGCIDPANYSEDVGAEICMERIRNKVWELEGYVGANEYNCTLNGFRVASEQQVDDIQ